MQEVIKTALPTNRLGHPSRTVVPLLLSGVHFTHLVAARHKAHIATARHPRPHPKQPSISRLPCEDMYGVTVLNSVTCERFILTQAVPINYHPHGIHRYACDLRHSSHQLGHPRLRVDLEPNLTPVHQADPDVDFLGGSSRGCPGSSTSASSSPLVSGGSRSPSRGRQSRGGRVDAVNAAVESLQEVARSLPAAERDVRVGAQVEGDAGALAAGERGPVHVVLGGGVGDGERRDGACLRVLGIGGSGGRWVGMRRLGAGATAAARSHTETLSVYKVKPACVAVART